MNAPGARSAAREGAFLHPRYEPQGELGRGAQGVVVRVIDREAPTVPLCAKVWLGGVFREEALLGEFALLARARIPGLVRAHDLARCTRTGAPFLVEDFVDGPEASEWVRGEGQGRGADADRSRRLAGLIGSVAATLAMLHDAGFVHGDLKPAHVRVAAAGPVVLDLGAAVSRARGAASPAAFTPAFAAPEVRAGGSPSALSDLFGLGALAWAVACGRPPGAGPRPAGSLRALAPWVRPALADLVEALVADHPRDRPEGARDVLARLGAAQIASGVAGAAPPPPIGRERELAALIAGEAAVRYVIGPSGVGKSHLARELTTRALLAGRSARVVRFPTAAAAEIAGLVAFLRGSGFAPPVSAGGAGPGLVVLDDLHLAPAEVTAALDAYRCRAVRDRRAIVIATAREAPPGADVMTLGPLDGAAFGELCRALGIADVDRIEEARAASGGSPGWLVASAGSVPLTRDTALERVRGLDRGAADLHAAIAMIGGIAADSMCRRVLGDAARSAETPAALAELCARSLVGRRVEAGRVTYALAAPGLARELAAALLTPEIARRAADALLAEADPPAASLLAAARAIGSISAADRAPVHAALLERAAARAREEGLRAEEIEALGALSSDPIHRTADRLLRLERLVRDTGSSASHPEVLGWLDDVARADPRALPLALRRRAEKAARDGDAEGARDLASRALTAAAGDPAAVALALATEGVVALFGGSYTEAERALGEARARLASVDVHDPEEIARVDHNLGVVALYRGRSEDAILAFERSLANKRALGDRAGTRSCLLNLGLALAKVGRLDDADRVLDEALKLARSLGQAAGQGWVLAARADVAVRRGDAAAADRAVGEAEAQGAALPAAVRADLSILRAQVALLEGDGARAIAALGEIDPATREGDPLIAARAIAAEAGARLATLPADPRRAARLAIAAIRRARASALPEVEAQARGVLRAARGRRERAAYDRPVAPPQAAPRDEDALWAVLAEVAAGGARDDTALSLARALAAKHGAERALVASVDAAGRAIEAWGADLDGLPVAEAAARLPVDLARTTLGREGPVYLRDAATAGGRGSRVAVAAPEGAGGAPRAVVVLEHRFAIGAFDHVTASDASRWATLAALIVSRPAAQEGEDAEITSERPTGPRLRAPARPARDHATSGLTTAFPSPTARRAFPGILGGSPALERALARLDAAIDGDLPVLIVGETGSGKELFARALHELGPRASRQLVAVNCGAIPDALFEAELFGHARGSFTGADRARAGLIARAERGTLFLDEIGELPMMRQAALLRALQERRYRPVGSDEEIPFDVRIVAATNRDLERAVAERAFRQDLLYRLNAVEIRVPPLRERAADIPDLARAFLREAGSSSSLSDDVIHALSAHDWPGNVRELIHVVQRLSLLRVPAIGAEHLPRDLRRAQKGRPSRAAAPVAAPSDRGEREAESDPAGRDERGEVEEAMARSGGNISHAAAALGLTRQGLKKRMVRLGMREGPRSGRAVEKAG